MNHSEKTKRREKSFYFFLLFSLSFSYSIPNNLYAEEKPVPEPYREDEFSPLLKDIRRFEIVTISTIPITILVTSLFYDIIYTAQRPEKSRFLSATENKDILGKIGISIGISTILGIIDLIINKQNKPGNRRADPSSKRIPTVGK